MGAPSAQAGFANKQEVFLEHKPSKQNSCAGDPDKNKAFFVVDIHPPEIHLEALEVKSQA